jgi:alpha-tubulin suppressor-like RCC1 family protein
MKYIIALLILFNSFACDETKSTPAKCGDYIQNQDSEECDGRDFANATCSSLGYYGGDINCSLNCTYDLFDCKSFGKCGDGIIQEGMGEECDTNTIGENFCQDFGYLRGDLTCDASCKLVEDECVDLVDLSAGYLHTCIVDTSGEIWCWGNGDYGQLGDGTNYYTIGETVVHHKEFLPVKILKDSTTFFVSVSAGLVNTCGLDSVGSAWCWGAEAFLGVDSTAEAPYSFLAKVEIDDGIIFTELSVGYFQTCAIDQNKEVWCWGHNLYGEGTGSALPMYYKPEKINFSENGSVKGISAGAFFTCATTEDGSGYCWGVNNARQLGNDATSTSCYYMDVKDATEPDINCNNTPVKITLKESLKFVKIDAGGGEGDDSPLPFGHACSIVKDETSKNYIYCWGSNEKGQLANNLITVNENYVEMDYFDLNIVDNITSGGSHSCITTKGLPFCWGHNNVGQLGVENPWYSDHNTEPTLIDKEVGINMYKISAGYFHTCAYGEGRLWCWGYGYEGQLGVGSPEILFKPTEVFFE